jgi:SAM-dependent methyltransferase
MAYPDVCCLICGAKEATIVFSYSQPDQYETAVGVTDDGYFRHWMQCENCGFHHARYSRDPDVLDDLYTSAYRDSNSGWREDSVEETFEKVVALPEHESETKTRVKWIKEQTNEIWDAGLVERGPPPRRMLDIGGATGVFAYEFRDNEWQSHVIDPDSHGSFLQTKLDIPLIESKFEPGRFGFKFDLIALVFVLEHFTDPVGLLRGLHEDLGSEALLYVEVPDHIAFKLKPASDDIFNSCHLWMFGPHSLTSLLGRCGFEVLALNRTRTKRGHYSLMALAGRG